MQKSQAALNQVSINELSESLAARKNPPEKERLLLNMVLDETFSQNSFLLKSLTEFMDDLIAGDEWIGVEKVGDFLAEQIDEIYNPEITLYTPEELHAFTEFDSPVSDMEADTVVLGTKEEKILDKYDQAMLDKYVQYNEVEKHKIALKNKDTKAKELEKAIILNLFHDCVRAQKSLNPQNLSPERVETNNSSWNQLADSFVGAHTLTVNSDSYSKSTNSKALLGILADGVSASMIDEELKGRFAADVMAEDPTTIQKHYGKFCGHTLAQATTKAFASFDFDKFYGSKDQLNQNTNMKLTDEEKRCAQDAFLFLQEMKNVGIKPSEDGSSASQNFAKTDNDIFITDLDKELMHDPKINLIFTALAPFVFAQDQILSEIKDKQGANMDKDLNLYAAMNYALEIDGKIVLVQVNDAGAAAYDEDGKQLEPIESITNFNAGDKSHFFGFSKDSNGEDFNIPSKLSVKIYNSEDVDKIAQISDGASVSSRNSKAPEKLSPDIKQSFANLVSVVPSKTSRSNPSNILKDYDDKTIIVSQKAS